jgi:hypothetical protein
MTYVAILMAGTAAMLLCLACAKSLDIRFVYAVSIGLHLLALLGQPAFEDDFYRFLWDGYATLTHGSPYQIPPAHYFSDPAVPKSLWPVLDQINYPEYPTIYGPTLQIVFALSYGLGGTHITVLRLLFALANGVLIWRMAKAFGAKQTALLAWSPFVIAETILHMHPDGWMALFLFLALGWVRARPVLAGAMLALATGCKFVALAAWPMLLKLKRPWRAIGAAVVMLAALYVPFALFTPTLGLDSAASFAADWRFNALLYAPVAAIMPAAAARILCMGLGLGLIIYIYFKLKSAQNTPLGAIFGIILLVSPTVNPWYLIWILPFAAQSKQLWPYVASVALPLSYLTGLNLGTETLRAFEVHPVAWGLEMALLGAVIVYDISKAWRPAHHSAIEA